MEYQYHTNQLSKQVPVSWEPVLDCGSLPLLLFPSLKQLDFVSHCFSTRMGGVSEGIFSTMNLSFTRGDKEQHVRENYQRILQALGTDSNHVVCSDQTHTVNVRRVTKEDAGKGVVCPKDYTDVDGLITDVPGLCLATFFADCVPIYLVDPVHQAIGLSHSGWRGTVSRMGQVTLEAMQDAFGTQPQDVYAAIGPSICKDCYEVSEDVAMRFVQEFGREVVWPLNAEANIEQKYLLDLWRSNEIVLTTAGVRPERIETTQLCTCCNPKLLFSHRASHGKRGNLGAFLMIKSSLATKKNS